MSYISELILKENDDNIKIIYDNISNELMSIVFNMDSNKEKQILCNEIKTILSILEKFSFLKIK